MMAETYLGYRPGDDDTAWGKYFNPQMAELPRHAVIALEHGPQADQAMLGFDSAATLLDEGYQQTENGYGALRGGGFHVAIRTDMPGVTPAMWDWWFGWHGSESSRYKLWHPRAHASAHWGDSGPDGAYVGRTSIIEEYLGSAYAKAAIAFLEPSALGLDESRLGTDVAVCARLGSSEVPVDIGWFIHHVRAVPGGAEMRSRFWMGGPYIGVRRGNRLADSVIRPIAAHQLPEPRDLLVHCAQEMNHLASFLPKIYAEFAET
ncbi:DAPG hydrolase family protein [Mycolicibacterium rhodesiae]|nr:hypothetical protein [Mycolicibacterium rhodesiae]